MYVDNWSNPTTPPQLELFRNDGTRIAALLKNDVADPQHPYAKYAAAHAADEFGTLTAADGDDAALQRAQAGRFDPEALSGRRHRCTAARPRRRSSARGEHRGNSDQYWRSTATWCSRSTTAARRPRRGLRRRAVRQAGHGGSGRPAERRRLAEGAAWVDPARIGVYGWSNGGYMTLMLLARRPTVQRCGAAGAPVTDWGLYDTHYTERYMGLPQDNADGYRERACWRTSTD